MQTVAIGRSVVEWNRLGIFCVFTPKNGRRFQNIQRRSGRNSKVSLRGFNNKASKSRAIAHLWHNFKSCRFEMAVWETGRQCASSRLSHSRSLGILVTLREICQLISLGKHHAVQVHPTEQNVKTSARSVWPRHKDSSFDPFPTNIGNHPNSVDDE